MKLLFLHGAPATGKLTVVRDDLRKLRIKKHRRGNGGELPPLARRQATPNRLPAVPRELWPLGDAIALFVRAKPSM